MVVRMIRRTPLPPRTAPLARSKKPIAKVGKAAVRNRKNRDAYYRSPEWRALRKQALERAGGRCECLTERIPPSGIRLRCTEAQHLEVHHIRYTKIRKSTTLGDLQVLCRAHHREAEARMPHRAAKRLLMRSRS